MPSTETKDVTELTAHEERSRSDFWKTLAIVSITVLSTVIAGWFTLGRTAITKQEVTDLMQVASPYALDRGKLSEELKDVNTHLLNIEQLLQKYDDRLRAVEIKEANDK